MSLFRVAQFGRKPVAQYRAKIDINGGNAGLDDEGFAQRWLELHPEDTIIVRDGSTRTA